MQTLWDIEVEALLSGSNRNRILNDGARLYISLQNARRAYRMHADPATKAKILNGFLKQWWTEAATW